MANKKISELESRASLSLSDLMAVGDPSTGYLYKTTISDLKTLTGAGVVSFNGRFGTVMPAEGDYTLTQLGDVIITSAANNDVLKYNGSNWVNTQLYTGTVAQYIDGTGAYQTFPTLLSSDRLVTNVRNTSGATITKGTVVYLNGSSGTLPTIAKAQANAESTSTGTYGVVQDDIANNANGYVVVIGNLSSLNTSAYNAGDILWLSPSVAGGYTTTKPVAPNHAVYVGIVTRSSTTQGTIEVKIQNGYELDELHNVLITSVANNDVLTYDTASSLWKNKAFSTLSTDTLDTVTTRGATTSNGITVGSVSAAGLSNLLGQIRTFASTGNTYMGASPASASDAGYKLDVNGTVRISNDLTMWDDGTNNGNSRALILRALGSTGNVQTGQIILDGFGASGQDYMQLSASNLRLAPTSGTVTITGTTPSISTVAASGFRLTANSTTNGFIFTQSYNQTSGDLFAVFTNSNQKKISVNYAGVMTLADLSGTGSRMVVADANGVLSTQAIPDLSGYVTLSTAQNITGTKSFLAGIVVSSSGIQINGSTADYLNVETGGEKTYFGTSFIRAWDKQSGGSRIINLRPTGLAAGSDYTVSFPAKSGTIAFTDDIPSVAGVYLPLSGGTLTGALNGTSATFSGAIQAGGSAIGGNSNSFYNVTNETSVAIKQTSGDLQIALALWNNATSGDNRFMRFFSDASAINRGSIFYDRGGNRLNIIGEGNGLLFTGDARFSTSLTSGGRITSASGAYRLGGFYIPYSTASGSSRTWAMTTDENAFGDFSIIQSTTQTGEVNQYRLYINPSGNIGVGTLDVDAKFKIYSDSPTNLMLATVSKSSVNIVAQKQGVGYTDLDIDANAINLFTNGNPRLKVTSAGLVGINTTNPNGALSIVAPASSTAISLYGRSGDNFSAIRFQSNSGATTYATIYSNSSDLHFENNGSARLTIAANGTATFSNDVKVKTLEVTNVGTDATSSGVSTYMRITVNGQNYLIPLHGTP